MDHGCITKVGPYNGGSPVTSDLLTLPNELIGIYAWTYDTACAERPIPFDFVPRRRNSEGTGFKSDRGDVPVARLKALLKLFGFS